ncbi:MAG: beta-L-arabinofuranosidase domain-containing protein [Prolixibacteraceae bacterium]
MKIQSLAIILIFFSLISVAQKANRQTGRVESVVPDRLKTTEAVVIQGFVGERLNASYLNRIIAQNVDRLVAPFNNRTENSCWQSEFWGKWFTSAVLAYRYKPELLLKKKLDDAVNGLIAAQTTDGYIGNYADDKHLAAWDIWGRKYCMLGLLAYYDLTNEPKALQSARKEADFLMKEIADRNLVIVKLGNHRGMAASSVLEPICLLYTRTGDKRYLAFAEEIVRQWETPDGPQLISKADTDVSKRFPKPKGSWYGWEQGQKAYEMMSCYEGLLELYRITGKNEYKVAVEKTWDNILDTEINITGSGSSMEAWFEGKKFQTLPIAHYQETCVTATWIKFSQQLLRLTGEAKYADAIEQTFYNALLGAMNYDGSDWAKYTPLAGQRLEGSEQCGMGLNCCVASGPRGLFTFPLTAVMTAKEGFQVNFFASGKFTAQTPGKQQVQVIQETDYPISGKVSISLQLKKPEKMMVLVRIPSWSAKSTLFVNGEPVNGITSGKNAGIERLWKSGDAIELNLDMRGRVLTFGDYPKNKVIVRGPVVLSRDTRLSDLPIESVIRPMADKQGFIDLQPIDDKKAGIWMEFKAQFMPESYLEKGAEPIWINLCDYASAGNAKEGLPSFTVWLPQLLDPKELP